MVQVGPANASTAFVPEVSEAPAPAPDDEKAGGEVLDTLNARDQFGFPTLLVDDFKLKVRVVTTAVTHTLYLTRDALDDIAAAYVVVANYIEGCAVTREEFDKWVEVEGDAQTAAHKRLADLDELRADIKRQQDAAQRQAEEAKARIEGRERRNAALARRGTVVSLSEQSARVAPEEGAGESKGDT